MNDPAPPQPDDQRPLARDIDAPLIVETRRRRGLLPRHEDRDSPPRFGAAHLLLWITMISVYFAVARNLWGDKQAGLGGLLILLIQAALAGAAWSGLSITISRRLGRRHLPIEPGQWLLVVLGARLALEILLRFKPGEIFAAPDAVVAVATCCVLVLPTLSKSLPASWKLLFGGLVLAFSGPLILASLGVWFELLEGSLTWAATGLAARLEMTMSLVLPLLLCAWQWHRGARWAWLHWFGIGTWTCWVLLRMQILDWFL